MNRLWQLVPKNYVRFMHTTSVFVAPGVLKNCFLQKMSNENPCELKGQEDRKSESQQVKNLDNILTFLYKNYLWEMKGKVRKYDKRDDSLQRNLNEVVFFEVFFNFLKPC